MCGITGAVWTAADKAIDAVVLTRMTDVLRHRGPDDEGTYSNECHQSVSDSAPLTVAPLCIVHPLNSATLHGATLNAPL